MNQIPERDIARFAAYIPLPDNSGFQLADSEETYTYTPNGGWYDEYGYHFTQQEFLELRFQEYALLDNELGFVLPDGTVFYFNENGGWEDEEGNLFDSSGKWAGKREARKEEGEGNEEGEEDDEDDDELDQQCEEYDYNVDDDLIEVANQDKENDSKQTKQLEEKERIPSFGNNSTEELKNRIMDYHPKQYVPVHFYYGNLKVNKKEIEDFLKRGYEKEQKFWIADILFDYFDNKHNSAQNKQQKKEKTGYGIIQCMNQFTALVCVNYNNQELKGFKIKLFVESIQEYTHDFHELDYATYVSDIQYQYIQKD